MEPDSVRQRVLEDHARRTQMARAALDAAHPDAATNIARDVLRLAGWQGE